MNINCFFSLFSPSPSTPHFAPYVYGNCKWECMYMLSHRIFFSFSYVFLKHSFLHTCMPYVEIAIIWKNITNMMIGSLAFLQQSKLTSYDEAEKFSLARLRLVAVWRQSIHRTNEGVEACCLTDGL